jgi:hypothetical protein
MDDQNTITKWVSCLECDGEILVMGGPEDTFDDWWCNDCDKKHNPEDYDDCS